MLSAVKGEGRRNFLSYFSSLVKAIVHTIVVVPVIIVVLVVAGVADAVGLGASVISLGVFHSGSTHKNFVAISTVSLLKSAGD